MIEDYLNGDIKVGDPILVQDKYLDAPTHRDENEYTTVRVLEILDDGKLKVRNTVIRRKTITESRLSSTRKKSKSKRTRYGSVHVRS